MVHSCDDILFNPENDWITTTSNIIDKSHKHYDEKQKSDTTEDILHIPSKINFRNGLSMVCQKSVWHFSLGEYWLRKGETEVWGCW